MTEAREQYQNLKDSILALLDEYSKFLPKLKEACPQLEENCLKDSMYLEDRRKQLEDNIFTISVIGEMKHGKSTLLNAMLGKPVFPKDVSEATAAISYLRHNKAAKDPAWKNKAVVFFRDNRPVEVIEHDQLLDYATRLGDKLNVAEEVESISVYSDSPFVENGVEVVDTLWTNTTFSKHAELTDEQISKSNAAIFLFKAEMPGKKSDYDFLSDAAHSINKFFFVVNRIDAVGGLGSEGANRVVKDIMGKMRSYPGLEDLDMSRFYQTAGLLGLLARNGYLENEKYTKEEWDALDKPAFRDGLLKKSGLPEFESDLLTFLFKGERMAEFFASQLTFLKNRIEESRKVLTEQGDALEGRTDLQELENKMQALELECERQRDRISENAGEINAKLMVTLEDFKEDAKKIMENEKGKFEMELNDYSDYDSLSDDWDTISRRPQKIVNGLRSRLTSLLQKNIFSTFSAMDTRLRGQLNESLRKNGLMTLPDVGGTFTPVEIRKVNPAQESLDEIEHLKQELAACEEKLEKADETEILFQNTMAEKAALEAQLQNTQARLERNIQLLGKRPDVKITVHPAHTVTDHYGWFEGGFFPHTETRDIPEQIEKDDSAGQRHDAEKDRINKQFAEKEAALNEKLEKMRGQYSQLQLERARMENLQKLEVNKRQALADAQSRWKEQLEKGKAEYFKRNKALLIKSLEDVIESMQENMNDIANRCSEWAQNYITQIQSEVDEFLNTHKSELESLKNTLSLKQDEKAKAKQTLDDAIQTLDAVEVMFAGIEKENAAIYKKEI